MKHFTAISLLLVAMASPVAAQQMGSKHAIHAVFVAPDGKAIELDTRTGILRLPYSPANALYDCGDRTQTCLTDHHGFAFAFSRACDEVGVSRDPKAPELNPKILSVLHRNLWVVFDASPNYLFHYVIPRGIVSIYVGSTPSFDFRNLFKDKNLQINKLDAVQYRITAHSDPVAACREY